MYLGMLSATICSSLFDRVCYKTRGDGDVVWSKSLRYTSLEQCLTALFEEDITANIS